MRRPFTIILAVLLLGMGWVGRNVERVFADDTLPGHRVSKPASKTAPLTCTIRSEPWCVLGHTPKITVALTNQTKTDLYLVGNLDASENRWRYPYCYFEIIGPDGKPVNYDGSRCGNMNQLREKDFVKVPPGKSFDPYQHIDNGGFFPSSQLMLSFHREGEYRIRFVYSTQNENLADWAGSGRLWIADNPQIVRLFKRVPKVEVRSNEVRVTILRPSRP